MKKKSVQNPVVVTERLSFFQKYKWAFFPMLFAFALYFNTLNHGFVLDDKIIFQDQAITNGLKEIPKIFTENTLPESQNIKPYRPITSLSFAIDYQFFKSDDEVKMASNLHLMNILYYSLALFLTFVLMLKIFNNKFLAVAISLLFAAHPIHTEVVANIKSRDEILAYLFGIIMLISFLKFKESKIKKWLYISIGFYFLAVLSKENAILFIIILLILNYYNPLNNSEKVAVMSNIKLFFIPALLYIILQRTVLGINLMPQMTELDNMLVGIPNGAENFATRIYIVGFYFYKMLFPHPLFYDYSLNYISKKSFASWEVWLSLSILITLLIVVFKGIIKKNRIAFGIAFMMITFALTCNFFILIGSTFAERFAFTPSLGFVIALVFVHYELIKRFKINKKYIVVLILPVLSLYSFKTVSRNANWKDNETLFVHDYKISSKSLRVQNNYGTILYFKAKTATDSLEKKQLFLKSIGILDRVTNKYENYIEAYIQKGINYLEIKNCEKALLNFEKAQRIAKYNPVVESNLGIGYINCGQPQKALNIFTDLLKNDKLLESFYLKNIGVAYFNLKNIDSAEYYFNRLKSNYPNETETDSYIKLIADYKSGRFPKENVTQSSISTNESYDDAYKLYQKGNKNEAEKMLLEFIKTNPNHAMSFAVLGLISDEKQQFSKAIKYYKKSIDLNPADYRIQYNLGNTYLKNNNEVEAVKQFEKTLTIEPSYINSYKSLELYYKIKNNVEKTAYYSQKIKELESK